MGHRGKLGLKTKHEVKTGNLGLALFLVDHRALVLWLLLCCVDSSK